MQPILVKLLQNIATPVPEKLLILVIITVYRDRVSMSQFLFKMSIVFCQSMANKPGQIFEVQESYYKNLSEQTRNTNHGAILTFICTKGRKQLFAEMKRKEKNYKNTPMKMDEVKRSEFVV